jgi:PAS domain S-box-containing protein
MAAERWSASLDARAERLASLLTLSSEAMLVWHLDEGIEFWNSGAERLYGFTSEEAVGRTSHALLQTKFPVEFIELITRLRNERHWSGELRHICKDGHEVIVESRQQLLSDSTVIEVTKPIFAKLNSICFFWRQLFSLATMQS